VVPKTRLRIPAELFPTIPPKRGDVGGRGVGPEDEAVGLHEGVQLALHHPRLDHAAPPLDVDLYHTVHLGDVEGEPRGGRLAGEARPGAAGGDGEAERAGGAQRQLHVVFRTGHDHADGFAQVDRGVRAPQRARGLVRAQVPLQRPIEDGVQPPRDPLFALPDHARSIVRTVGRRTRRGLGLDALGVMSFNVRGSFRDLGKKEACWPSRAATNVATIGRHAPHLVGLQECQRGNLLTYGKHLPRYERIKGPRYGNVPPYDFNAILYDPTRLELWSRAASG
jgi:hypothetical protein